MLCRYEVRCIFRVSHMVTWKMRRQWEGESLLQLGAAAGGGTVWMQFWNGCRNCSSEWMHCSLTAPRRSSAHSLERKSLLPAAHSKFLRALLKWNNEGCPEQTWRGGTFFFSGEKGDNGQIPAQGETPRGTPRVLSSCPSSRFFFVTRVTSAAAPAVFYGKEQQNSPPSARSQPRSPNPIEQELFSSWISPSSLMGTAPARAVAAPWCLFLGQSWFANMGMFQPCPGLLWWRDKSPLFLQQHNNAATWRKWVWGGFFSACQAPRWGSRGGIAVGAAVCALHWVVATPESRPALGSISLDISACYSQPYSYNHRITAWFVLEQTWKIIPAPATGRDTFHKTRLLRACPWTLPGILRSQNTTQPWAGIHPQNGLKWNAAIKQCPLAKATVSLQDLKHQNANLQYSK